MLISWERQQFNIDGSASVGIGTTTPSAKLEVNGYIKLTSGSGTSITFADGTVQTTAWTGSLCSDGDYAESVDVTGNRTHYEPGDVLVVDPDHPGYRQTFGKDFSPWRETHVEACGPDGESLGVVFETASPFETPGWMKDLVDWFNRSCQPFSSSSSSISSAFRTAGNSSALRKYSILSLSVALG